MRGVGGQTFSSQTVSAFRFLGDAFAPPGLIGSLTNFAGRGFKSSMYVETGFAGNCCLGPKTSENLGSVCRHPLLVTAIQLLKGMAQIVDSRT